MKLNDLLTSIESIEISTIILYPKAPFHTDRIDCTLCSDENGEYYFTLNDTPGEKIFSTDQLPSNIETIEFQLTFNLP